MVEPFLTLIPALKTSNAECVPTPENVSAPENAGVPDKVPDNAGSIDGWIKLKF